MELFKYCLGYFGLYWWYWTYSYHVVSHFNWGKCQNKRAKDLHVTSLGCHWVYQWQRWYIVPATQEPRNLYIITAKYIKGHLNKLPLACVGDMAVETKKKGKPDLKKKILPNVSGNASHGSKRMGCSRTLKIMQEWLWTQKVKWRVSYWIGVCTFVA